MTGRRSAIAEAVARAEFGEATAWKRGRDPRFPYVPVVLHPSIAGEPRGRSEQLVGLAYRTQDEARRKAERVIHGRRVALAARLALPESRALREQHGLPRNLADIRPRNPLTPGYPDR